MGMPEQEYASDALVSRAIYSVNPVAFMRSGYAHCRMIVDEGGSVDFLHLEFNKSYEKLTGLKNLAGLRMTDVFPGIAESNPEFIKKHRTVVESGIPDQFEIYLKGVSKWYDISLYSPQKGECVSLFDDITERKQTEERLRQSEERFRLLFENHSAVMLLLDPDTGEIMNANSAASEFYGWSIEKLKLMRIQQLTSLTAEEVKSELYKCRTAEKSRFLFEHRMADGSPRNVEVFSNLVRVAGKELLYTIIHDVTKRKYAEERSLAVFIAKQKEFNEAEKARRQLDKQYQTLISASPDSIITTHLNGIISSISDIGLEIFGASKNSELTGLPFSTIVYPGNLQVIEEIFDVTLREGLVQNREILLKKKNNTVYSAEISAALIQDYNSAPSSYMMIIRDISQRKIIENELFHAKKLISLGEMASGIAHEIYQPINNIGLMVDKLLMTASRNNWSSKKEIQTTSDKIFENIIRAQTIIDNIRSFSSTDNNYISSDVNINKSIRNALLMVSEQCKHRSITLDFKPEQERFPVTGNIYKFEQVMFNLIKNSMDALEEKKQLNASSFEMKILIRTFAVNNSVVVSVEDNGIGISEKNMEYIMHPFYTTKESGKGTGLGLSISYGIIKEMNGNIRIKSAPMRGTTVIITLPKTAKKEA